MHKIKIITWFEISNTKQGSHHKLHNSISHQNKLPAKNFSATAESQQMLPAATSGCYFTSHCTVAEDDSPGTGKFPPDQICVKQAAGRFASLAWPKTTSESILRRQSVLTMKDIPSSITNYIICAIAEHFCNSHSTNKQGPLSPKSAFCTTVLFLGFFYRIYDLRWA